MRIRKNRDRKPSGRIRRTARRIIRPAVPYAAALIVLTVAALVADSRFLLGGAVFGPLVLAGDRLRMHWGWHYKGGKAAARKRRAYQGEATAGDLAGLPVVGVPIGTVRRFT